MRVPDQQQAPGMVSLHSINNSFCGGAALLDTPWVDFISPEDLVVDDSNAAGDLAQACATLAFELSAHESCCAELLPDLAAPQGHIHDASPFPDLAPVVADMDTDREDFGDEPKRRHRYEAKPIQCTSTVVQRIKAPPEIVWSVVRRFDKPQSYKHFVRSCRVSAGGGFGSSHVSSPASTSNGSSTHGIIGVGSIREVKVVSGLPASMSMERLEVLDDERRIMSFSVLGGDHRLKNYCATTMLEEIPVPEGVEGRHRVWTLAVESYVVDVPEGNTREETITFVDTVIKCNLQSLAQVSERLAARAGAGMAGMDGRADI